jgi:hypothetical protein
VRHRRGPCLGDCRALERERHPGRVTAIAVNPAAVLRRVARRVPTARSRKDEGLAAKVRQAYLDHTFAATAFAETISPKIFGREIPQTLLLHANKLNADTLDEMLRRYRERGYRFISLDQAMADPAYATPDTLVTDFGPTWLWRWRTHLGLNVSFSGDPEPPAWVIALFNQ